MSRAYYGDLYCAMAQQAQRRPAALAVVAVPVGGGKVQSTFKITDDPLTGPRAMLACLHFALDRLDMRQARATLHTNLKVVVMTADEAASLARDTTKGLDPYYAEKVRLARRLVETGSEIKWLANSEANPHLEQARALADRHMP